MRGGERYNPPNGWTGFAIKLRNKFGGDFEWLGKTGERGKEWCVAFHGIGRGDELIKAFSILNSNLRAGPKQRYCTYKNIRKYSKEGIKIFVSEYEAPEDFKCIWSMNRKDGMGTTHFGVKQNVKTERLFVYGG